MTYSAHATHARPAATGSRLLYVDNLRIALTALVVLHHAALTYSSFELWFYDEPGTDGTVALLDLFIVLNQTWFMGAFFLISGYFTPRSVDRKGPGQFMRERLVRLGIPVVVFLVLLRALLSSQEFVQASEARGGELSFLEYYLRSWDLGPMWFLAVLLLFSLAYAAYRRVAPHGPAADAPAGRTSGLLVAILFVVAVSLASYVWRIWVPSGSGLLRLPTPDFMPQYAGMFVLGILARRRGWGSGLRARSGVIGLAVAVVSTIAVGPILSTALDEVAGGGTWQSLLGAVWQSAAALGLILALLVFFRRFLDAQGRLRRWMSANAYAVYVIHPVVLVGFGYALIDIQAPAALKFVLLSALGVGWCWILAAALRASPRVKRILG